jgi:DNA-3-methyladenine glycosylase II
VPLRRRAGGYAGLANIVVSQQVSVASARAIWARFEARFAPFDPMVIRQATDQDLRGCGLSSPKMRTLRAVAAAIADGRLSPELLPRMAAEDAHAALTAISGIGPWTADIYLMFCIGHGDAFAAGDLALQEAARLVFALPARPDAKALAAIAESWRPWRSVSARLLWRYYAIAREREGLSLTA